MQESPVSKIYQRSPEQVREVLTDPRGDFKLATTFVTLDHVSKLRSDYASLMENFKDLKVLVHQHQSTITYKLVDHHLLKETIKNYLHDFEIQLRSSTSNDLSLFKDVIGEKLLKLDSFNELSEKVRFVSERDHQRDLAKLREQLEFVDEKHSQQRALLENRLAAKQQHSHATMHTNSGDAGRGNSGIGGGDEIEEMKGQIRELSEKVKNFQQE